MFRFLGKLLKRMNRRKNLVYFGMPGLTHEERTYAFALLGTPKTDRQEWSER